MKEADILIGTQMIVKAMTFPMLLWLESWQLGYVFVFQ